MSFFAPVSGFVFETQSTSYPNLLYAGTYFIRGAGNQFIARPMENKAILPAGAAYARQADGGRSGVGSGRRKRPQLLGFPHIVGAEGSLSYREGRALSAQEISQERSNPNLLQGTYFSNCVP